MSSLVSRWKSAGCFFLLSGLLFWSVASYSQMAVSSSSLNFGTVQIGTSSTLPVVVSNPDRETLTITEATISGNGFSFTGPNLPLSLGPRQSTNLLVTFAPQVAGTANGALSVVTEYEGNRWRQRSGTTTFSLSGVTTSPGYLSPSTTGLNFGNTLIGNSQVLTVSLTNSGGSSVAISQAAVTGSGFSLTPLTVPMTLAAGQSAALTVTFTPTVSGSSSGTVTVTSNASDATVGISLSGNGTSLGQMALSPASLSFGTVDVGTTQNLSGVISATGSNVTISSISSTNSQFTLSGLTLPVTIAAGQSTTFAITFTPQAAGAISGSLSFVSNASNSPSVETVSGTGQLIQHTVTLSWNASTSTVSGYNVYRGTVSGGPYAKLDASLDAATTYADSTVQSGQAYYYVTTAVDSAGAESGYSNQVGVQVPTP